MKKSTRSIEIPATLEGFEEGQAFLTELFRRKAVTEQIAAETMLVFEALFHNIQEQGFGEETALLIEERRSVGDTIVRIGFEGKMFVPVNEEEGDTPENRILTAYDDKMDVSYHAGYNTIKVTVKRSYSKSMVRCGVAALVGIVVYVVLRTFLSPVQEVELSEKVIYPIEKLFANAVLMIAAPVTFFSLLKNMTDSYIVAERDSSIRKFQKLALLTSVVVTLLAVATAFLVLPLISGQRDILAKYHILTLNMSFTRFLSSLVPSNIFEPFETISPFPLIMVASITAYSFVSVGKHFFSMKRGIDMFYMLFSRMLNVIMASLPFFSFLAMLDILLGSGPKVVIRILLMSLLVVVSVVIPAAFYGIRLKRVGIRLGAFLKKLIPLIKENVKINSPIDAGPFNIRYCAREYGINRKRMETAMPVLAQINLDGNCYLITLVSLLLIFTNNDEVFWIDIVLISVLVIFLSLGAPNQPGSITIGLLIITYYMHAYTLLPVVILAEVILGSVQNIFNVVGDIVAVAIDDMENKRAAVPQEG